MNDLINKKLTLRFTPESLNTFERNYIKSQLAGIHKKNEITKYLKYVKYYFKLCSQFQIPINDEIVKEILSKAGGYEDLVYKKIYYNPELIPQQFFLVIKQRMTELGRNITDYYFDSIEVEYLSDQIIGFLIGDVEWRIR